jgi:hypothetical protein
MQISAEKHAVKGHLAHLLALNGLLLIVYLTVMRSFSQFGFYADDWRYLDEMAQLGSIDRSFPGHPLQRPLIEWVFAAVDFDPAVGYLLLAMVLALSAVAMYWMMIALFPRRRMLAVIASALYVLYPGDPSRMSITQGLGASGVTILLSLLALALFFTSLRLKHRLMPPGSFLTVISAGLYLLCLMMNGDQALLVPVLGFAGAIWIDMSKRGLSYRLNTYSIVRPAITNVSPFLLVLVSVVVWRIVMVDVGHQDVYASSANFNPVHLLSRLFDVYYDGFVQTPVGSMLSAIPFLGEIGVMMPTLAVLGLSLLFGAIWFSPTRSAVRRVENTLVGNVAVPGESRFYLRLLYASVAMTGIVAAHVLPLDRTGVGNSTPGTPFSAALVVVIAIGGGAFLMLLWSVLNEQYGDRRREVGYAFGSALAVIMVLLVSFQGRAQADAVAAWNLQQQYVQQLVASVPRVSPRTHFHFEGVEASHGTSYVFTSTTENMLRLVYGDESITASVAQPGDNRYLLNSTGLYRDEELVAERGLVVYLTLVPADCAASTSGKICGRLVLSQGGAADGRAIAVSHVTGTRSPVDDLFGIRQENESADAATPTGFLAAPSDAPSE